MDAFKKLFGKELKGFSFTYHYFCPETNYVCEYDTENGYWHRNLSHHKLNRKAAAIITELDPCGLSWEEVMGKCALVITATPASFPCCTFSIDHYEGEYPEQKLVKEHSTTSSFLEFDNSYKEYQKLLIKKERELSRTDGQQKSEVK